MAETPNKDIEKQLRDYAQRRRDAAGTPAMHPATRAMLQAEVKQRAGTTAGTAPAAAQRTGWALFWPRFAFAFAIVAVIGLAGIFFFPPSNKAKNDVAFARLDEPVTASAEADKMKASPPLAAEPVSPTFAAPAVNRADREVATKPAAASAPTAETFTVAKSERSDKPAARQEPMKALKSAPAQLTIVGYVATNSFADSSSAIGTKLETRTALSDSNAKKSADSLAATSRATAGKSARGGGGGGGQVNMQVQTTIPETNQELKERSFATAGVTYDTKNKDANRGQLSVATDGFNNMTQRYRNVAVTDDSRRSGKVTVLEEFTVEQNGQALTIVDRDGSVYNGFARQADAERQNVNAESGNPIQMVPNSNNGGRGGAAINQTTMNRAYSQNQAPGQAGGSQNLGAAQTAQFQNAPEPQNYFFRVEGTNRSLNQRVVVVGNLLQNNAGNAQNIGNSQAFRSQQNAPAGNQYNFNNQQTPTFNNFINGRVQLGNAKASEFNASSVGQQ